MYHVTRSPCKDCKERSVSPPCHDICEKYQEYSDDMVTIRNLREANWKEESLHMDFIQARIRRAGKKQGNKGRRKLNNG